MYSWLNRAAMCMQTNNNLIMTTATDDTPLGASLRLYANSTRDEERFAALLVLTRASTGEVVALLPEVFAVVGLQFVLRLLRARVSSAAPDLYRPIGLGVVALYALDPSLAGLPAMGALLSPLLAMVAARSPQLAADAEADAWRAIAAIANAMDDEVKSTPVEAVIAAAVSRLSQAVVVPTEPDSPSCSTSSSVRSCAAASEALERLGERGWQGLLHAFAAGGEGVFASAVSLLTLLETPASALSLNHEAGVLVAQGLLTALQTRLGPGPRDVCLRLAGHAVAECGPSWLTLIATPTTSPARANKLFLLVVHLACVELRMTLEDSPVHTIIARANVVAACFSVVEMALYGLTALPDEQVFGEEVADAVLSVHRALCGGVAAVADAFARLDDQLLQHHRQDGTTEEVVTRALHAGCMRVLAIWASEETEALRGEIVAVLPRLVTAAMGSSVALAMLLPAFVTLSTDALTVDMFAGDFAHHLVGVLAEQLSRGANRLGATRDVMDVGAAARVLQHVLQLAAEGTAASSALAAAVATVLCPCLPVGPQGAGLCAAELWLASALVEAADGGAAWHPAWTYAAACVVRGFATGAKCLPSDNTLEEPWGDLLEAFLAHNNADGVPSSSRDCIAAALCQPGFTVVSRAVDPALADVEVEFIRVFCTN